MLAIAALWLTAFKAAAPQASVPEQTLGKIVAVSGPFASVASVRELPDGSVLINDIQRRRLMKCDAALVACTVVADTSAETQHLYGTRIAGLIAAPHDTSYLIAPGTMSMTVIDPSGRVARIGAAPRPVDVTYLMGGPHGTPGFDAQGRLVYRVVGRAGAPRMSGGQVVGNSGPDSMAIVRFDLVSRSLDTAAYLRLAAPSLVLAPLAGPENQIRPATNPIPIVDDWAVLSDGTIAVVRGQDYHVDFYRGNGSVYKGPRIPFPWKKLTLAEKEAIIDSAKTEMEHAFGGTSPATGTVAPKAAEPAFVSPDVLSDYLPAFTYGAVKADAENRIWIRAIRTSSQKAGPLYDVVDQDGNLAAQVRLPAGTTIAGFGKPNTIFLGIRDTSGVHIVRANVK